MVQAVVCNTFLALVINNSITTFSQNVNEVIGGRKPGFSFTLPDFRAFFEKVTFPALVATFSYVSGKLWTEREIIEK